MRGGRPPIAPKAGARDVAAAVGKSGRDRRRVDRVRGRMQRRTFAAAAPAVAGLSGADDGDCRSVFDGFDIDDLFDLFDVFDLDDLDDLDPAGGAACDSLAAERGPSS